MNATQLLTHFDRIIHAPDAVPRLRRFILDLAVRGKLVEQDAGDEPVAPLLSRLRSKKVQFLKAGVLKRNVKYDDVSSQEHWCDVPNHWTFSRLGAITNIVMGTSPPGTTYNKTGEGIPLINGPVEFSEGSFGKTNVNQYTTAPSRICENGDFLICVRGSTTGRTNVAAFRACIGRGVAAIQPIFDDEYVRLCVSSRRYSIIEMGRGIAFPSISRGQLENLVIPLPPLAEQHRIVAKVDELMQLCDQLEAAQQQREAARAKLTAGSLARLNDPPADGQFPADVRFHLQHLPRLTTHPEQIRALRQTILNLAVRGKLVPQDEGDEPASSILKCIKTSRKHLEIENSTRRQRTLPPIDSAEEDFPIPKNWQWARIGDLLKGDSQNGYGKKPDNEPHGVAILRISAGTLRVDGVVAEEEHKFTSGVSDQLRAKFGLIPGDLLACRFNGNRAFVGRLSLFTDYLNLDPIYPDKLIRLRVFSEFILPKVVRCFAESTVVRKDIESYCATTVGNWGISASNLKLVKIPIPPLAEQHRIVAKVEELLALCERLEAQLTSGQTASRCLLEATLHEALSV